MKAIISKITLQDVVILSTLALIAVATINAIIHLA